MTLASLIRNVTLTMAVFAAAMPAGAETIRLAMNGAEDLATNSEYAFVVAFRDALAASGITVEVHPSDALGSEKERLGQTTQGLIQVNLAAATTPASMSPLLRGTILPFFFRSSAEFDEVIARTPLLETINKPLIENGVRVVAFNQRGLDAGIFNTKRAIASLADLEALRMRALNKSQVAFFEALGVQSTVVPWGEVANALQTGIVDGYVNPPNSALRVGHTQYLKHYTAADLAPSMRAVLVSEDWWSGMDEAQRKQVALAVQAGVAANRAWVVDWGKQVAERFREAGVTVTELAPGERDKMKARAQPIYKAMLGDAGLAAYESAFAAVR
ncbi:MAG: TRAP transporter substrate-binding protein [Burkholderiaceae bacterium]